MKAQAAAIFFVLLTIKTPAQFYNDISVRARYKKTVKLFFIGKT
jgi:hypothetical protein